MAWQLARRQCYRKPVVYREKSLDKTGLHCKNEADSVGHIHMFLRRWNKKNVQEVGVINEKMGSFNL